MQEYVPQADTIISRLLITDSRQTYSADHEDQIMMDLLAKLNLKDFSYMDIGVCHPIIRNNTFLFYESGFKNGVLVEPNPDMCKLIAEYRPENRLFQCGICAGNSGVGTYHHFRNSPGLNTFVDKKAARVSEKREPSIPTVDIPLININDMIGKNFDTYPDVLDIDCEGMDLEILTALDTEKYPIKIICAERQAKINSFRENLFKKGYLHYMSTNENYIFLRNEYLRF